MDRDGWHGEGVQDDVRRWWQTRHYGAGAFAAEDLLARKAGATVAVVLPALNEQDTVGRIVSSIRADLMPAGSGQALVDELVVVDSGSTDDTAQVAAQAGARVLQRSDVLPEFDPLPGKGEAMWRGVAATQADLIVFLDSDVTDFSSAFVTGLIAPLLGDDSISLVKAIYDRPLRTLGEPEASTGGGRVTELVARPLLASFYPQLTGFVQPLAGEYAVRRTLLERLPFPTGYGVEIGLLIDALDAVGLFGLAQVDLVRRSHRHSSETDLGLMALEIMQTVLRRLERHQHVALTDPLPTELVQFTRGEAGYEARTRTREPLERPALVDVADYRSSVPNRRADRSC